jgi:hypothetical protein
VVTAMAAAHQTTARVVADQDALQQTIGGVELGASRPSQRPAHWRAGGAPPSARRRTVDCQTQGPCKRGLRAALVRFRRSRCTGGEVNTHLIRPRRCSRRPLGTGSARSAAMGRSDQGVTHPGSDQSDQGVTRPRRPDFFRAARNTALQKLLMAGDTRARGAGRDGAWPMNPKGHQGEGGDPRAAGDYCEPAEHQTPCHCLQPICSGQQGQRCPPARPPHHPVLAHIPHPRTCCALPGGPKWQCQQQCQQQCRSSCAGDHPAPCSA